MEDIEKLLKKIESIQSTLGIGTAIICLILLVAIFFLWHYLKRKIEKSAEVSSEKIIKQFQSQLDKELQEFSIQLSYKYQNQTKAIDEVYSQFAMLTSYLDFLNKGDKYEEQTNPYEDSKILISHRREFIQIFERRKIYLPESINRKIYDLLPVLDNFIDTYKSGLFSSDSAIELSYTDNDEKFIVAGMWNQKKFDQTVVKFASVQKELEHLFRSISDT